MPSQSVTPTRLVLEGVPRVHFYEGGKRCPEDITFPSVLRACLEYMGEEEYGCQHTMASNPNCKIVCTYSYLLGTSGIASFLSWRPGWHTDNMEIMYMSDDPGAPHRRALESVGYGYEILTPGAGGDCEAIYRQRIIASLRDKGRPVIAFGIIGPPETCLITGYDEEGDVLVGWNFFQKDPQFNAGVEFEPSGYFRKRDWFRDCQGLILIGDKQEVRKRDAVYGDALRWNLQVARTPVVTAYGHERYNGIAAYTAWAEAMQRDEDFTVSDESALRAHYDVHNLTVGLVAEARWYGALFLMEMVRNGYVHYKMAEDLLVAAARYAAEHNLMWKLWDLAGGNGNPQGHIKTADPAVRRQMVPIILEARDKYADAANHIERALAR